MQLKAMMPYRLSLPLLIPTGTTYGSVTIPVYKSSLDTDEHYVEMITISRSTTPPSNVHVLIKWSDELLSIPVTLPFSADFFFDRDQIISMMADSVWTDLTTESFYIYFCKIHCEKTKINKRWRNNTYPTGQIEVVKIGSGEIRESSSIINPTVTFEWEKGTSPVFSYVYIPSFNRFYFVENITFIMNQLWSMTLSVDVLNTYQPEIYNLPIYVERSEIDFNTKIVDTLYPLTNDKLIREYEPANVDGFTPDAVFSNRNADNQVNIILVTMRGTGVNDAESATHATDESTVLSNPDYTNLPSLMKDNIYVLDNAKLRDVQEDVIDQSWLSTYFVSCIKYPFNIKGAVDAGASEQYVHFGSHALIGTDLGGTFANTVKAYMYWDVQHLLSKVITVAKFVIGDDASATFLDYEPYTKYEIYLPFKGWITLSASQILGHTLLVSYTVNFIDGSAMVYVTDETDGAYLYSGQCQLGTAVSLSTNDERDTSSKRISMVANTALTAIRDILGAMGSFGSGQMAKGGSQLVGMMEHGIQAGTELSLLHDHGKCDAIGGEQGLYAPLTVRVRITTCQSAFGGSETVYEHLYGKPTNEVFSTIADISGGFFKGTVHVEEIPNATDTEMNMIESLIADGVIY